MKRTNEFLILLKPCARYLTNQNAQIISFRIMHWATLVLPRNACECATVKEEEKFQVTHTKTTVAHQKNIHKLQMMIVKKALMTKKSTLHCLNKGKKRNKCTIEK